MRNNPIVIRSIHYVISSSSSKPNVSRYCEARGARSTPKLSDIDHDLIAFNLHLVDWFGLCGGTPYHRSSFHAKSGAVATAPNILIQQFTVRKHAAHVSASVPNRVVHVVQVDKANFFTVNFHASHIDKSEVLLGSSFGKSYLFTFSEQHSELRVHVKSTSLARPVVFFCALVLRLLFLRQAERVMRPMGILGLCLLVRFGRIPSSPYRSDRGSRRCMFRQCLWQRTDSLR